MPTSPPFRASTCKLPRYWSPICFLVAVFFLVSENLCRPLRWYGLFFAGNPGKPSTV